MNDYKAAIVSFFLPLISAVIGLFTPVYHEFFLIVAIGLYAFIVILYITMLVLYKKKKRQNAARIISTLNMLLFSFFFTFPLLKIWHENLVIPIILTMFFIVCIWLAFVDQNSKTPLVFPENREKKGIWTYIFYAIPVVAVALGGGANFIVVREMHLTFGDSFMSVYGSVLLYIVGCWFGFLMASLYCKGTVKEGRLIK